jgi:hypothetical protein
MNSPRDLGLIAERTTGTKNAFSKISSKSGYKNSAGEGIRTPIY